MQRVGIVIPAGGTGSRFGSNTPKQYLPVGGVPVIVRCIETALLIDRITCVIVAASVDQHETLAGMFQEFGLADSRIHVVGGGSERQESVYNALQHPAVEFTDVVAIHDAVRPFASIELWNSVIDAAVVHGAAIPVLPLSDTIKRVEEGVVLDTVDRSTLRRAQTPQVFHTAIIRHAYIRAREQGWSGTDCASLCERTGVNVHCVVGDEVNIKITTPLDATLAEAILLRN